VAIGRAHEFLHSSPPREWGAQELGEGTHASPLPYSVERYGNGLRHVLSWLREKVPEREILGYTSSYHV